MKELTIKNMPTLPFEVSEALNQLRVNLGFCGDNIKTIMVTSSTPDEGKTFLAMNLWKMMANVGMRTLLIDCDLRNSVIRTKYGVSTNSGEKMIGIAHYLSGQAELQDVLYQTNISNGFLLPLTTAIANPTILLEGKRFGTMIQNCRDVFDIIIVDTPPLGSVADALNISTRCDGTLLVVRSNAVPRKLVENSVQLLKRTETPLLGIALNRVDVGKKSSLYYDRYYRYGNNYKHYGYGEKAKKVMEESI